MTRKRISALLIVLSLLTVCIPGSIAVASSENSLVMNDGKVMLMDFGSRSEIPEILFSHPDAQISDEVAYDGKEVSVEYVMSKSANTDIDVVINTDSRDLSIFEGTGATVCLRFYSNNTDSRFNVQYINTSSTRSYYPNPALVRPVITEGWQIFEVEFDDVFSKTGNTISFKFNDDGWANTRYYSEGDTVYLDSIWIQMSSFGSETLEAPVPSIANGAENQPVNLSGNNDFNLTFAENLWPGEFIEEEEIITPADAVRVYEYDIDSKEYVLTEQAYGVVINENVFSVIFDSEVKDVTGYRITFDSDYIISASGAKLPLDLTYEFGVGIESVIFSLTGTSLENGAENIDDFVPGFEYVFEFNHSVKKASGVNPLTVYMNGEKITNGITVSTDENCIRLVFENGLKRAAQYRLVLSENITDTNGFLLVADTFEYTFSTTSQINGPALENGRLVLIDFGNPDDMPKASGTTNYIRTNKDIYYDGKKSSLEWDIQTETSVEFDFLLNTEGIDLALMEDALITLRYMGDTEGSMINVIYKNADAWVYYPNPADAKPVVEGGWQTFSLPFKSVYEKTGNKIAIRFNSGGWGNAGNFSKGDKYYFDSVYLEMPDYGKSGLEIVKTNIANGEDDVSAFLGSQRDFCIEFSEKLWQYDRIDDGEIIAILDGIRVSAQSGGVTESVWDYDLSFDGNIMTVTLNSGAKLNSTYTVTLNPKSVISISGKKLDQTQKFTFKTQNAVLSDVAYSGKKVIFDVETDEAEELEFVVIATDENNRLLKKVSSKNLITGKSSVGIDFELPENAYAHKAYVLSSTGSIVSHKFMDFNTGFKTASWLDGEKAGIESEVSLDTDMLSIRSKLSGIRNTAIIKITAPGGEMVSENIVLAGADGNIEYSYVFPDESDDGIYDIEILADKASRRVNIGYVGFESRAELVNLANSPDYKTLSDFILKKADVMNLGDVSDEMVEDISRLLVSDKTQMDYTKVMDNIEFAVKMVEKINSSNWSEIADFIDENINKIEVINEDAAKEFSALSDSGRNNVCALLRKELPVSSLSEFSEKLTDAIDDYKSQEKGTGSSGGSGGSGSKKKSSGGSFPVDSEVVVQTPALNTQSTVFTDLEAAQWAADSIMALYYAGVISPAADSGFRPNDNITREEFVKLVVCALVPGEPSGVHTFTDSTDGAWYVPYISYAHEKGLVTGYPDGSFGVGNNITREDMAVLIGRALGLSGNNIGAEAHSSFADAGEISGYAFDYVDKLTQLGVLNGMGDGTFAPKSPATRAQAAKVIASLAGLN